MTLVTLHDGRQVGSGSPEWAQECREVHDAAVAIRRMSQPMQRHAYETLARTKGKEYAERVRQANGLTRKLLDDNGMTYGQIREVERK